MKRKHKAIVNRCSLKAGCSVF